MTANSITACYNQSFTPEAIIHNYGTNDINLATIELFEVGNPVAIETINWTGNLTPGSDTTILFLN